MVDNKSLDVPIRIIAALLCDIRTSHGEVFGPRSLRLTTQKVVNRCKREGIGFLTKTLPRLGKAFDKALLGEASLDLPRWPSRPPLIVSYPCLWVSCSGVSSLTTVGSFRTRV